MLCENQIQTFGCESSISACAIMPDLILFGPFSPAYCKLPPLFLHSTPKPLVAFTPHEKGSPVEASH